jgi:hypothetical protein
MAGFQSRRDPDQTLLRPQTHANKYPFSNHHIAALHAATQYRGLDLDGIDFYFGGSTLGMFANRTTEKSDVLAMLVPGTEKIMVVRHKMYIQDYSAPGFQFERLCTGHRFEDLHEEAFVNHMMVMQIGNYKVFFEAETDAVDSEGAGIEIKASNPRYWGSKNMFQMISSGFLTLFSGIKKGEDLVDVNSLSLEEVCARATSGGRRAAISQLEASISLGIGTLKEHIELLSSGGTYRIVFNKTGLELQLYSETTSQFFPPIAVVNDLLKAK